MNMPVRPSLLPATDALVRDDRQPGIALRMQAVDKRFGANVVLHRLDLQVPEGQFVAIVGRSGCGKSTLLRLISGLDRPTSGAITLGPPGAPRSPRDAARVMFQEPRLLPWARVLANVEIGLGAERGDPASRQRAWEALRYVGLETRADDWPSMLSGGQKQRVALARALVSRPRLLALDEPLGALDALTRIEMQQLVARVWLDEAFTAILVTHDVSEALMLADRVLVIEDGSVALDLPVALPRPRQRACVDLVRLEDYILNHLLRDEPRALTLRTGSGA